MADYQTLSIVLTGIGMIIALTYYGLQIRNQNRTRQAQLFTTLYTTYQSQEFRNQWTAILKQEWTDFDDFWEKYGQDNNPEAWTAWQAVASFFHGIGILLKKGLLEIEVLDELLAPTTFMAWVAMGPILKGFEEYIKQESVRNRFRDVEGVAISSRYSPWSGFEYLFNELRKREEEAKLET